MAADGRGDAAGVSDHPAEAGSGELGQTRVIWRVRSDHSDLCDPGPHSDDPWACWWRIGWESYWDLNVYILRWVEVPTEF